MSAINPLSNETLLEHAPALFTEEPHYEVSEKYHFIPTIEVINEIKQHNWYPLSLNLANRAGYETVDGLRKWCQNNMHPDYFKKPGRLWHIHRTKLPYVMKNGYNIDAGSRHTKEIVWQK